MAKSRKAGVNGTKGDNGSTLRKSPTGIQGFDEITDGGLPQGRPTLICGAAGCGKTLMAMEFLVRGAMQFDEPGVFMAFEETAGDLTKNVASLGFDLDQLVRRKKLVVDHVHIERSEIEETGEYDLEGLFIRLNYAIDSIGAKRVVLDTIESLFSGLSNTAILRAELRRLFAWLKNKGVTAVITGERGDGGQLTRQGLEEYVSDCVIVLDHRVNGQVSTRRMRVVKYRGSTHGTNEYPFLIDEDGLSVLPITSMSLNHKVSSQRVSTGVPDLDEMFGGKGFYRGSSVLISGTAGTGKTSLAAHFANATCQRGERCYYFAFEESQAQILRNMRSIGVDLGPWVANDLLRFYNVRPTLYGLEMHLAKMHKLIGAYKPSSVIIDPISNLVAAGSSEDAEAVLTRVIDFLKMRGTTALLTNLTSVNNASLQMTEVGISSLVDTWILLRSIELGGERNRGLYILKSRGMDHSNQIREFVLNRRGIDLVPPYLGAEGVLTGSARVAQEAREAATESDRQSEVRARAAMVERKRKALQAQIALLESELAAEAGESERIAQNVHEVDTQSALERTKMARSRRSK